MTSSEDRPKLHFEHTERIRWVDLDAAGVLNNAVYLTLLEQARFAYFGSLGLVEGHQFPFLLGDTHVRYLHPGQAGSLATIRCGVVRLGNKSFDMEYEVFQDEVLLARAEATLVWVNENLESVAIPAEARTLIEPI
ncbi:MAG: acyl-CoA thioester hydrolase [Planctomycetota bacterium]|jgi:acyl-CoA thioester hydrolase